MSKKINENYGIGELPSSKLMKMSMKLSDIMKDSGDQHYTPVTPSKANHLPKQNVIPGKVYDNPYAAAFVPAKDIQTNEPECGTVMPDQEETDAHHHLLASIKQGLDEKLKHEDGKWVVYPIGGGGALGKHSTKKAALKQLTAIEIGKQKK